MDWSAGEEKQYVCPGESHPISRSVHLSRLASFFPNCRDCPFRTDTGHLPPQTVARLQSLEHRLERQSLFTIEGVRGTYLNELSRKQAHLIAAALASTLWERAPLKGQAKPSSPPANRSLPTVLVGHDERPAAPDLMTGVTTALCRMGCQVIDVGLSTKPGFWFAADHLQTLAGIYVNGAGCPPAGMALDFVASQGRPISRSLEATTSPRKLTLEHIESQIRDPYHRATRHAGPYRTFKAAVPYEAGLWKHFPAQSLRPLRICCGSGSRLVARTLAKIHATLPGELTMIPLPQRVRNLLDPSDPDVERLARAVCDQRADLGVLIDDDGQGCGFLDELGRLIPVEETLRLMAEARQMDHPNEPIVLEDQASVELETTLKRAGLRVVRGGTTLAQLSDSLRGHHAILGGGASGRYWFREAFPTSDALIALAAMLTRMSRSETPLSALIA